MILIAPEAFAHSVPRRSVSVTTDRLPAVDDSDADTPTGLQHIQAPRSRQQAILAGRDTQLHRERGLERVRVPVRCRRELQAKFQPQ